MEPRTVKKSLAGIESDKNQKVFSMPHETQAAPDESRIALRMTKD